MKLIKALNILAIVLLTGCYNYSEKYVGYTGYMNMEGDDYKSFLSGEMTDGQKQVILNKKEEISIEEEKTYTPVYKKKFLKTQDLAEKLNLELPMRCDVDWNSQSITSTQAVQPDAFFIERMDGGSDLPKLIVEEVEFKDTPIEKVILKILNKTGIELYSYEDLNEKVDIESIDGSLENVLSFISKQVKLYYTFDARRNRLHLSRTGKWNIHLPFDKEVILSVEDALRGAGLSNLIVDWEDRVIILEGDFISENTMRKTLLEFQKERFLVAYDMDIYRVYPKDSNSINWINMIKAFKRDTIKVSSKGIIGRAISVSENLDMKSLHKFLKPIASPVLLSRGTYILPNHWQGRFDIGKCSREPRLETDLFVMMETQFKERDIKKDKLDMKMVLRTSKGDVSTFKLPSRLGENILILGIPTHYFVEGDETIIHPNTELLIFLSPRIIELVPEEEVSWRY